MDQSTRNRLLRLSSHPDDLNPASLEPGSDRAREDAGARISGRRRRRERTRREDVRDVVKAGAIVGATILAMRLYAAIAPSSPW